MPQDLKDFSTWMRAVNRILSAKLMGMDSNDLPDFSYRDSFDDGATPAQAAAEALEYAGADLEEFGMEAE